MRDRLCPMWSSCGGASVVVNSGRTEGNRCRTHAAIAEHRRPSLSCYGKIDEADAHDSVNVNPANGVARGLLISARRKTWDLRLVRRRWDTDNARFSDGALRASRKRDGLPHDMQGGRQTRNNELGTSDCLYRSISPSTMSSEPTVATMSAMSIGFADV